MVDRRTLVLDIVQWLVRDHGAVRNGEADVVIADAERGILVIEVKSGVIRRDGTGIWWAGPHRLERQSLRPGPRQPQRLFSGLDNPDEFTSDVEVF